ncbi:MAG: glycosyltransferase family 4 protein [Lachnospiraceae bacterium]|nr:glycosyltransferase family 4 protein [Lachnospiraceae bacterium]
MSNKWKIAMFGQKHVLSREGGVEIVVKELSTRMAALGHEVTCYDRRSAHVSGEKIADVSEFQSVRIRSVWTVEKKGLAAMTSSLSAALRTAFGKYDIVHIHAEGPAAMCWIPKLGGKKVIVTVHGLDWARAKWGGFATRYIKWGEKQAVRRADEIIVLSRGVQKYFSETYGRKTIFIPNGVTQPAIQPAEEISSRWGLKKGSYVLFLGRIVPEKGLRYLVEAWKGIRTDLKLVIAGGSSDTDSFVKELRGMADERVIFTGFQQGRVLEELYSNAYLYVLPSDLEGMPLSLLEAMSYGNACLVSDIPECAEVVEDKAAVFRHGNVDDLRRVLQELLDDPGRVGQLRSEASDFIVNKYSWDDVVARTLAVYGSN